MNAPAAGVAWWREPTRDQWSCFLAAWAGWVLDAFDFTIYLLVAAHMAEEFSASLTAVNGVVTATLVFRLLGGAAAGAAADRWGRRPVLMASIVMMALCDAAIAFAPSLLVVLALRVLFGFAMGAEWTAGATLAMENWPARSRGIASGVLQGSWAIGYFLAALVSRWVVPAWGWRGLFLLAVLPALLVIPIRYWVREDPGWRHRRGAQRPPWRTLLEPAVRTRLLWAGTVLLLGFGVYYALVASYPAMLRRERGLDAAAIGTVVALFNVGMLAGATLAGPLFARYGARAAIGAPALLTLPLLPLYLGAPPLLPVGALLTGVVGAGSCGATPLMLARLFPAEIRARAVGVVYHVGALVAAATPPLVARLGEARVGGLTLAGAMAAVAVGLELALAALVFLLPLPAEARAGAAPREQAA